MQKSSRNHYSIDDTYRLFEMAKNTIGIPDTSHYHEFRIMENVKRIRVEMEIIHEIEKKIMDAASDNKDVKNIDDMKGIGTVHAAAIVSEIGETDQFDSALKLQSYGGRVPMVAGSGGKSHAIGISKIRNPYLSNAVHECAVLVVTHKNEEFLGIFNREIAK
jgi:transposase